MIAGREEELAALYELVRAPQRWPAAAVVRGEAGIGKTMLWSRAVEEAARRGLRVLTCRPGASEAQLAFAGLGDLLAPVLEEALGSLPSPQRRALAVALLLEDAGGEPPDPRAIGAGFLHALVAVARNRPVLVAIDDVQWLDSPSQRALEFAFRRLREEPVCVLAALRAEKPAPVPLGLDHAFATDALRSVEVGPLGVSALAVVLHERLGASFRRSTLRRIREVSGGNPFYALELGRELLRTGAAAAEELPLPSTLRELVRARVAGLPAPTVEVLLVAAALSAPTLGTVEQLLPNARLLVRPAVEDGVVELDGERILFTHPLLATLPYLELDGPAKRRLHRRLAKLAPTAEERARHLAAGADGKDAGIAATLDEAAALARARGAPEVAAELLEHALAFTPVGHDAKASRLLAAAEVTSDAGDWKRAHALAELAAAVLPSGPPRAEALLLVGETSSRPESLERALVEAGSDAALRARIGTSLTHLYVASDFRASLRAARTAVLDAERADDRLLVAQALAMQSWFEGACVSGDAEATAQRGVELEREGIRHVRGHFTSAFTLATLWMWRDDHERARERYRSLLAHDERRGDVWGQAHALLNLAQVEWRAGEWERAATYASEGTTLWPAEDAVGGAAMLWIRAVVAAHRGELEDARLAAEEALALAGSNLLWRARNTWILGFVELEQEHVRPALERLVTAEELFNRLGALEPGMRLFVADLIEAYVAAGMLDRAESLADELVRAGVELERPRASAIGARGRGLVLAQRGELPAARAALEEAARVGESWPVPFERARTLLALGRVQRRSRRWAEARATLAAADAVFAGLGSRQWSDRARSEADRLGGRAPSTGALTPTERRVAALVAEGRSTKEVASALFVSPKTIEGHLSRIYDKLGVRSRTELARAFAETQF
jgi:DNA-binding CsgD family transcriptional regulator